MAAVNQELDDFFASLKEGNYPIRPGASLSAEDSKLVAIKYNHLPSEIRDSPSEIVPDSNGHSFTLSTVAHNSKKGVYKYTGVQTLPGASSSETSTLILVFSEEEQVFYLERVGTEYSFDLSSTSTDPTARHLANQFQKLNASESVSPSSGSEDELFSDEEDDEPDPDNPWDYRHFLKKSSTDSVTSERSDVSSVRSQNSNIGVSQDVNVKITIQEPVQTPETKNAFTSQDADGEESEADDDGGLIIEGLEAEQKPRRFGLPFSRPPSSGPISLRSALNSSADVTPMQPESESEESDEDEDVEELHLPSPAAARSSQQQNFAVRQVEPEEVDDQDDLEAELEQALGSAQEDEVPQPVVDESSSESEEE